MDPERAVRGKTIRLTWTEGPTSGKAHDHTFHEDGTVEWRDAEAGGSGGDGGTSRAAAERPKYAAMAAGDEVCLVSYLAASGYTLTVALDFRRGRAVGIASGAKEWFPVRGTFEVFG